jgi:NitT/TauT family transport system permease protein
VSILDSRRGGDELASLEAGLDALEAPESARTAGGRRLLSATWPPVLTAVLLLLSWQLAYRIKAQPPTVLPSPADVGRVLGDQLRDGTLLGAMGASVSRGGLGFLVALGVGTPLGLLIARIRPLRRGIGPLLAGLQSLPSVAWVPAAVIVFGVGDAAIYAVVLLGATPSIASGMVAGIDQIPPLYRRVGLVLGAAGLSAARHVLLPAALPGYLAGLRQGWAYSWRSLMAAELIVRVPGHDSGLGQLLDTGRKAGDMRLVLAGIFGILLVGIAVEVCLFAPLERRVLRRRGLLAARA